MTASGGEAIDAAVAEILSQVESLRRAGAILTKLETDGVVSVVGIDAAVAELLSQVETLRRAGAILVTLAKLPAPSSHGEVAPPPPPPPAPPECPPAREPPAAAGRHRGGPRAATLEFHAQLRKLLGEGVFSVRELSARLGRPVQAVYQALSNAKLSLADARREWAGRLGSSSQGSAIEGGEVAPAPPLAEPPPLPGRADRLGVGDVVFVRSGQGPSPTYLRCTVSTLPGESGEFKVRGPEGVEISLEVGDAVAPFRDAAPTFRLGPVEGGAAPGRAGEADPAGESSPAPVSEAPASLEGGRVSVDGVNTFPLGSSFDFTARARSASVPELREEVVKRQRGCSGKSVQLATSFADGHAHVASVDRMGYGTTVKDSSGHVHGVLKWEVLPAHGVGGHGGEHGLTLLPHLTGQGRRP